MKYPLEALKPKLLEQCLPNQLLSIVQQHNEPKRDFLLTVDKVISAICEGQSEQITLLEWIYCIESKAAWDEQHPEQSMSSSEMLWKAAIQINELRHRLLWRLALCRSGQSEALAPSLIETFSVFKKLSQASNQFAIEILDALLTEHPSRSLVLIAYQWEITHHELVDKSESVLPTNIAAFQDLAKEVSPYFITLKRPTAKQFNWLLRCFEQMSELSQIKAVDHLLIHLPIDVGSNSSVLVKWLKKNYIWTSKNEKWKNLTERAKNALRKWIGTSNYGDFKRLVNKLLNKLELPSYERNRLKRRRDFWENYSDRFSDLRILMPQESVRILDEEINLSDILLDDGSDPAEICIFDFGKWLIVEFFRGAGGEIRLFENTLHIRKFLFETPNLSVKRLRHQGGVRLDHEFLWQHECERWLWSNDILPNAGTDYFKGLEDLPKKDTKYSFATGLPKPPLEKLQERQYKVQRWQKTIERLEEEAKHWCLRQQF